MKKIYELTTGRALKYFLQHDSYTTLELPSYVDFSSLLEEINSAIDEGKINFQPDSKSLMGKNINYEVLVSKDGLYSWRRITLINPLYYVYFCKLITSPSNWKAIRNKFREFESNDLFLCSSTPVSKKNTSNVAASVLNWWEDFEQKVFHWLLSMSSCSAQIFQTSTLLFTLIALNGYSSQKKRPKRKKITITQDDWSTLISRWWWVIRQTEYHWVVRWWIHLPN